MNKKTVFAAMLLLGTTLAFAEVWDVTSPLNTDPISQGDDRIRELKAAIQSALRGGASDGDEAIFPGPSPSSAPVFHYRGLKGSTAARPAASVGGLYYNTTTGTIQRSSYTSTNTGGGWEDVTENAAYEAIHQKVGASLASVSGVVTLPETGNSFNVTGTEAVTSVTGWSAGVVIVKWVSSRVLTYHATNLILKDGVSRTTAAGDISILEFTGSGTVREVAAISSAPVLPTKQYLTSGTSATYTTPTNCRKLVVKMWGAGGGGGAAATNNGSAGGDTSFNSIVAAGGGYGTANSGGQGAGGSGGSGSASLRIAGHLGPAADPVLAAAGADAPANSGVGGQGANGGNKGGSGGNGEYAEFTISSPAATYTYTIGAGGAGGAAGTRAGGAGGSGLVVVEEYY